jgi:predicted RecB family nuclease
MLKTSAAFQLSASDLVGHLQCRHLTHLDVEALEGKIERRHFHDPLLAILIERGERHELDYLTRLANAGYEVVRIEGAGVTQPLAERTLEVMRRGPAVISQAALLQGVWSGRADVLRRIDVPSAFGDWSYEVIDTKLARETKGGTVLQLSLYSDLLSQMQGVLPEFMHVVTPGSSLTQHSYHTREFAAYYRYVKRRLEHAVAHRAGLQTYPEPTEHCEICNWRVDCHAKRRLDDHLCLVAGITKVQIGELSRRAVDTVQELAQVTLPLTWRPERGARQSYERVREQARVQVESRVALKPVYEPITFGVGLGLCRLPAPSPGDLFLDIEGDPFVATSGLEYLIGCVSLAPDLAPIYQQEWALTREAEARAFKHFVDFVMERWVKHPDMHIYHYAPYEPSALKRLMGRYALCEDEIDRMLRGRLFVDLYAIVRQSVRAGVESYSIKNLEALYGYERPTALADARRALAKLQGCLELDDLSRIGDDVKGVVAAYNRDDCISALKLREWLEQIRSREIEKGVEIPRPTPSSPEPSDELDERQQKVAELARRLTVDVALDPAERNAEQHARWILAHVLDWYRREQKSVWWEYYRLADLSPEDLFEERTALSGLTFMQTVNVSRKVPTDRYAFPPQETEIRGDDVLCAAGSRDGEDFGEVEAISLDERTIDVKKRGRTAADHPPAVFKHDLVRPKPKPEALLRIGEYVAENGLSGAGRYLAARDLLLRNAPRLGDHPLQLENETPVDAAIRIAPMLAGGILPIQGPPGAGKTYTAARMVCALVASGKRVGITANSHTVIRNLLNEVVKAADALHIDLQSIQKPKSKQEAVHRIRFTTDNEELLAAIGTTCQVGGATAWLWSREDAFEVVDVLFVDEAAQMCLADVLAVSHACKTLVLVGDPQQLEQPILGSHPEGTAVSALDHILSGQPTIEMGRGLFLDETWRLHPDVCAFTSELFYGGRLHSRAGADIQIIRSASRISGAGLRFVPVKHHGNQNSSPEEAGAIRNLVDEILGASSTWTYRDGTERPVTLQDILIIAPYNAQVFELQERLPGARIGTVDRFQGQEAAIVIYSMTTSSREDAPHGMEFLYSLNRLNVATSRAMCLCVLVGSLALFEPDCRTPSQMRLANAFCRFLEMAQVV